MEEQMNDFLGDKSQNDGNIFSRKDKTEKGASIKNKRDEFSTEIRKKNRESELMKKRRPMGKDKGELDVLSADDIKLKEYIAQVLKEQFTLQDLLKIGVAINSNDRFERHYGVIGLRKILSVDGPPIQQVIDLNFVPILIEFMKNDKEPILQLESAWALTNVASGTTQQTQSIIDKGGIPLFARLLNSPNIEVAEQAVWAIGNISGENADLRDLVIYAGAVDPLIRLLKHPNIFKPAVWALSNLCRGRPAPKVALVKNAIPALAQVVKEADDPAVLSDALWGLATLSDSEEVDLEMIINTGVIPALVAGISSSEVTIAIPALRVLGNILSGDEKYAEIVMSGDDILKPLLDMLNSSRKPVKKEACLVLSNIAAGSEERVERMIRAPGLIERLICMALTETLEIKKEALFVLNNALVKANTDQITKLCFEFKIIDLIVDVMNPTEDAEMISMALRGLNVILHHGIKLLKTEGENPYLNYFSSLGGDEKLVELQKHKSDEVYDNALTILETFYDTNDPM